MKEGDFDDNFCMAPYRWIGVLLLSSKSTCARTRLRQKQIST